MLEIDSDRFFACVLCQEGHAHPSCVQFGISAKPARQIAANAGEEASIVAGKILEADSDAYGFNAQTHEYGDMVAMGIVDPVKVVRTALEDAGSVAGLLITTEAMIADAPKKDAPAMPAGGGMPDMGGMGMM